MALPSPNYPGAAWDGNEQSTANDVPGDDTRANGADHNEMAAEVVAIIDDLRAALAACGASSIAEALGTLAGGGPLEVDSFFCLGELTIAEFDALGDPIAGTSAFAEDAGTPAAAGSDALTVGDLAEYDGDKWIKLLDSNGSGFPPDGTRVLAASTSLGATLYSPLSNPADSCKILAFDGTSITPSSKLAPTLGQVVVGRLGLSAINTFAYATYPGIGTLWAQTSLNNSLRGGGLTTEEGPYKPGAKVDGSTVEINGSGELQVKAGVYTANALYTGANSIVATKGTPGSPGEVAISTNQLIGRSTGTIQGYGGTGARQIIGIRDEIVDAVLAVSGGAGGSDDGTFDLDVKELSGFAVSKACAVLVFASNSQYGGRFDPNANCSMSAPTNGSIIAQDGAAGWFLVKTDATGNFTCTVSNSSDETVWFGAVTAEGVDVASAGTLVRGCVPDDATWSA